MVPLLEPDVGLSDSQGAPPLTVHVPFELMAMAWAEGFTAPCVAVKVTLLGEAVNEAADTVSVTEIVLATPPLVTVIVALFVPTTADDRAMLAAMDPLPLPDDGLRVSQGAVLWAVQLPFELTVTVWLAGLAPLSTPENVNDDELSATVAEGAVTVKEMGMETDAALVALMVTRVL